MSNNVVFKEMVNLKELTLGFQLHVDSRGKRLLVVSPREVEIGLVGCSDSAAAYLAVFGKNEITPEDAVRQVEREYCLKTVLCFPDCSTFVLFVKGKN